MCDRLVELIKGLKEHLDDKGDFAICRSDGEPMNIVDALRIGLILEKIDEELQDIASRSI